MALIDSHCHLDNKAFDEDRDAVLDAARAAGVEGFLAIGTGDGPPDLEVAVRLADAYPDIWATVGVHPHDAAKTDDGTVAELRELCAHPKVIGIGEIGLDYHYDHSPREVQRRVFVEQLALAEELKLPIAIHTREAWEDTLDLLRTHWAPAGLPGIMHCFTGTAEQAQACLDMGFYISMAGVVTFKRNDDLREAAKIVPADRLLVETDSPFLTPEPYRKIRRNEPKFVVDTAGRVAEIRGEEFADLARSTTANFRRLFGLQVSS
jgi:TatD DNase family protein